MDRRSTSAEYTHFGGDITAQVNSSHGIRLSGGSAGGIVEAVGDDTNVNLTIRAQGAGTITLGATGQAVAIPGSVTYSSGAVLQVGSTAPWAGFIRQVSTGISTPSFSTDLSQVGESTVTITGANSSHSLVVNARNLSTDLFIVNSWVGSTANEAHIMFAKRACTTAVAASTFTMNLLVVRF